MPGFPGQLQVVEGARAPQVLVLQEKAVQGLEASQQGGALESRGHGVASEQARFQVEAGGTQRPWQASTRNQRSSNLKPRTRM